MLRKLVIAALLWPSTASAAVQLMPGVRYSHVLRFTPSGPVSMFVVTAPAPTGLYRLKPLLSNGTILGRETVSSMERDVSAQVTTVGVNGDFFAWANGRPSGILVRDGVLEHQSIPKRSSIGIDGSGGLRVDRVAYSGRWGPELVYPLDLVNQSPGPQQAALFTPAWGPATPSAADTVEAVLEPLPPLVPGKQLTGTVVSVRSGGGTPIPADGGVLVARGDLGAELTTVASPGAVLPLRVVLKDPAGADWPVLDALGGGPALVQQGRPILHAHEALLPNQLLGRDPRTAIGQRADGGIVMVVVDGRQRGYSIGITNWDLAQTLVRYGCVTGSALDSGGSSTLAFDGTVLNHPSDPTGERPVGEALVLAYEGVFVPQPAPVMSPNGDGVDDVERLSYKLVRPSSVHATLVGPGVVQDVDAGARAPGRYTFRFDAPEPEGRWSWDVDAVDDLGRTSSQRRVFLLDTTLGFLRVGAGRVSFRLARPARVQLVVQNRFGAVLRRVSLGERAAGRVVARVPRRDGRGRRLSGTYVLRVTASSAIGASQLTRRVRFR